MLLESGTRVPVDLRLAAATGLAVDESLLIGESVPVRKHADRLASAAVGLADRANMAYAGTIAARGPTWRRSSCTRSSGASRPALRDGPASVPRKRPPKRGMHRGLTRMSPVRSTPRATSAESGSCS